MRFGLTALCMAFALAASAAARVAVPSLPVSPYADTEVATNISLRSARTDAVRFDLRFQLDGTPTNNLSLCFGRDVNTNGVLEVGEVETVYGWRAGRYFVEDVVSGEVLDVVASKPLWSCFLNFIGVDSGIASADIWRA